MLLSVALHIISAPFPAVLGLHMPLYDMGDRLGVTDIPFAANCTGLPRVL